MPVHSILRRTLRSLPAAIAGLLLITAPHGWTQSTKGAGSPGLFPDAEPVLVPKASLRGLLEALLLKDVGSAGPQIWQLLTAMFRAKDVGTGPSEFLAAAYRVERLKGSDAAMVQNCLLSAWSAAQTLGLFTPENVALMDQGLAPRATRGLDRGKPVSFDAEQLPVVVMTTNPPPPKTAAASSAPAPLPEPPAVPPAFVLKRLDVRLHERVSLDEYGLRNIDFRVDSVDSHSSVSFLFEDRTAHHNPLAEHRDSLNKLGKGMGLSDGINRMTAFTPEAIPETSTLGVRLITLPFAAIYLDEDIGTQLTLHLVIRVAAEALLYDQLPPERRKLYEIQNPP